MKKIVIADKTLCFAQKACNFREKIEVARLLEKLNVDVIELPEISEVNTDTLFVKTISSLVKNSVISVAAGSNPQSIELAGKALCAAQKARIRIELPVSTVSMEYNFHKKQDKMLDWIAKAVTQASNLCVDVEFCALDATRAEKDFLINAFNCAKTAGARSFSLCDYAQNMLPDEFADFVECISNECQIDLGVSCEGSRGMSAAQSLLAVKKGAVCVKTAVCAGTCGLEAFGEIIRDNGNNYGISTGICYTSLNRNAQQISRIIQSDSASNKIGTSVNTDNSDVILDKNDGIDAVTAFSEKLGYDLSDEDKARVYEEFVRVAEKKTVGAKELEAIIASSALQVPSTYKLKSYVINNGNIITASAQLSLEKNGEILSGISNGDGPIDAAFRAVEQIIGYHYELDDFQIQSVTQGREAMGCALVKLRYSGKLYSGNGISTDIIGASIRAYISAVNKIVYEGN